jgi:hypothetical protein
LSFCDLHPFNKYLLAKKLLNFSSEYELQKLRDTKKKCVKLMKRMEKQAVDMDKIRHRRMTMVLNKRVRIKKWA